MKQQNNFLVSVSYPPFYIHELIKRFIKTF